jgi:hypothetical protein
MADLAARVPVETVTWSWVKPSESSRSAWLRMMEGAVGGGDAGRRRRAEEREERGKRRGGRRKQVEGVPLLLHESSRSSAALYSKEI